MFHADKYDYKIKTDLPLKILLFSFYSKVLSWQAISNSLSDLRA
jgi:hypothetical protein